MSNCDEIICKSIDSNSKPSSDRSFCECSAGYGAVPKTTFATRNISEAKINSSTASDTESATSGDGSGADSAVSAVAVAQKC